MNENYALLGNDPGFTLRWSHSTAIENEITIGDLRLGNCAMFWSRTLTVDEQLAGLSAHVSHLLAGLRADLFGPTPPADSAP